jgi:uncharacterized membrane protein
MAAEFPRMSVELMPSWQRRLFAWFINRQARKASAKIHCPACKAVVPPIRLHPDLLWEAVVECPQCGHVSPLPSFISPAAKTEEERFVESEEPVSQPASTRIVVEDAGSGRRWEVPAKGGCSFMLVFGTLWLTFSTFMAVVVASSADHWIPIAFISVFVLIGLGLLYFALLGSRARHTLELDAVELVHTRRFLGRTKRKAFPRESIRSVKLVVFYEQNYKPIHGIEIMGERRKIRFGSVLTPEEKAWLCQDLRQALGLEQLPPEEAATSPLKNESENTSGKLVMERGPGHAVIQSRSRTFGTFLLLFGSIFVGIASFMLWGASDGWMPWEEDAVPFFFLANGFLLFWCLGVSMCLLIGLGTLVFGWKMRRTVKMLHADQQSLTLIATCGSRVIKHVWNVQDVRRMSLESGAKVNGVLMYHGVILLRDRAITFGTGAPRAELRKALAMLGEVMGRDDLLPSPPVAG